MTRAGLLVLAVAILVVLTIVYFLVDARGIAQFMAGRP